ncbi:MAG: 3-chloro-4-hydroxyphenylacetate reductive dehalogenase precursor [Candidatus Heimdallarchaeota archaeon LC_3]|nr:MAG: 3-chloro-4-hydroxyphenylacetate reductive dehalogenase precursor [Candidatus Heimdallarchaeota archaeon LC_3]
MSISINQSLCNMELCEQECISSCPQNIKNIPTLFVDNDLMLLEEDSCTNCLLCVNKCPLNAIEIVVGSRLENNPGSDKKLDIVDEFEDIFYPFEVDPEKYKPFNEKNVIFSRYRWDKNFSNYNNHPFSGGPTKISLNQEGYSKIEYAASQAAWTIENIITENENQEFSSSGVVGSKQKPVFDQKNAIKETPENLTIWIKKFAKFSGANLVGITKYDPNWFYTANRHGENYHFPEDFKSVIVFAVEMDEDGINTTPRMSSMVATGLGYSKIAFVRSILAKFINNLGYNSIPAGNQVGLSVPLAVMAGLGGYGRHGLLITKSYGSRVRIAKIVTDMPLIYDKPNKKFIKSVNRFCDSCFSCARNCPSASISFEKFSLGKTHSVSNNPGILKYYINPDSCYDFWIKNGGDCSNCIAFCEYSHSPKIQHKFANFLIQYFPIFNPIWPHIGKLFRYGGNKPAKKFWKKLKI